MSREDADESSSTEMSSVPGEHVDELGPSSPQEPSNQSPPLSNFASELAYLTNMTPTDGTYRCRLCGKLFGYKNGLIRHVRLTHMGEKPYQCDICSRRFGYKHILMEHQNLHFGNRPYACSMCDKRFAARSNLIQHRIVHKRPFHCGLCGKRFDRDEQLQRHLFAHPQALLSCNSCSYAASSQSDLNRHLLDAHHPQAVLSRSVSQESEPQASGDDGSTQPPARARRQGIDAICSQLGAAPVHEPINGDEQPVIKKEKFDDGFDKALGGVDAKSINGIKDLPTAYAVPLNSSEDRPATDQPTMSTLPGIHEAFSHRGSALHKMPAFSGYNFNNLLASSTATTKSSSKPPSVSSYISPTATNRRPTAQLPPITQVLSRPTRDQATQHTARVPGIPDLDEVLAYHVNQGSLFRCPHCNIIFFERGMYFLHVSLHGTTSPWECSICHVTCADKNEFTLHFVNQEHGAS